jgi:hypothetical protein
MIQLTVDPDKMKQDARRVGEKAEELKDRAREEFRED